MSPDSTAPRKSSTHRPMSKHTWRFLFEPSFETCHPSLTCFRQPATYSTFVKTYRSLHYWKETAWHQGLIARPTTALTPRTASTRGKSCSKALKSKSGKHPRAPRGDD